MCDIGMMNANQADRIKVLYIAGWGRSGSTILSNILGQVPGVFSIGEARYIWQGGLVQNGKCGCGRFLRECETWGPIVGDVFERVRHLDAREIADLCYQESRQLNLLRMFVSLHTRKCSPRLSQWLQVLEVFYSAVHDSSPGRVIVDSSKSPIYAAALRLIPKLDVYVIHLVRDPRPVAYSWMQRKEYLDRHSPAATSFFWNLWNLAIEDLGSLDRSRYFQLRYEDFVENPRRIVDNLLQFSRAPRDELPFLGDHTALLGITHNVSGNPDRFERGQIEIRADVRWLNDLSRTNRRLVTFLTWPLMIKYDFRIH